MYSEPGSNRYGHYCPQDFKSGVSTYSTIRATLSSKRRVQMYDFIFILPNILPRTWELYLTPITNARIKHPFRVARPNFLSEVVRCGTSQKKPLRDSSRPTALSGLSFWDVPQIAAYHKKLLVLSSLKTHNLILS